MSKVLYFVVLAGMLVAVASFVPVQAKSGEDFDGDLPSQSVDLPASTLTDLIPILADLFDTAIVADASLIEDITTPAISGRYPLHTLLQVILSSTSIDIKLIANGVVLKPKVRKGVVNVVEVEKKENIERMEVRGNRTSADYTANTHAWSSSFSGEFAKRQAANDILSSVNRSALVASPTANLADTFGYLSGITISRDFGEGLSVSVRGVGPSYQTTLLNGHTLAVNENVRDSGQFGRAFRFDVLPVQHIQAIELVKSPKVDAAASGIGATISMQSIRPLSMKKQLTELSVGIEGDEKGKVESPRIWGLKSWVSANKQFGLLVSASSFSRDIRQDHFQTWNWEPNGNSYFLDGVGEDVLIPSNRIAVTIENENRDHDSQSFSFQWRPSEYFSLDADHFYSSLTSHYTEQRWLARLDTAASSPSDFIVENGSLVAASFDSIVLRSALDTSKQIHSNSTSMLSVTVNQNAWRLLLSVADTSAISKTASLIERTRIEVEPRPFSYSLLGGLDADVSFAPSPFPNLVADAAYIEHASSRSIRSSDKGTSLVSKAELLLNEHYLDRLSFGVDWRDKHRQYRRRDFAADAERLADISFMPSFVETITPRNFLSDDFLAELPSVWQVPSASLSRTILSDFDDTQASLADLGRSYAIQESVLGAFFQGDASYMSPMPIDLSVGLRWQYWESFVTGVEPQVSLQTPVFRQNNTARSYWLPSVNMRVELSEDALLKFSASHSLAFPSYSDLQPGLSLNTTEGVRLASGGNPELKPIESRNIELHWLWSGHSDVNVSFGGFLRALSGFVAIESETINIFDEPYLLSRPENSRDFSTYGAEADMQIRLSASTLLNMSGTWLAKGGIEQQVELVPDWNFKAQLVYENHSLSARVGLDIQSELLFTENGAPVPDTNLAKQRYLRADLAYWLSDSVKFTLSAKNLLSAPLRYYFEHSGGQTLKELELVGANLAVNLSVKI
ncbi:TonB-dependent receptor [Agaribacter flavus]|uniref:TonB-dependent receptor n=1 Tax=Agaribacter flavus TaxID=1902781 RepID=A0ABV7FXT4_9ALTE